MKKLRVLLFETPEDPYMNLAIEEAIVRARSAEIIEDDTLRLWRNKNAVVIGYFQVAEEEVDLRKTSELRIPVVRRFTGGGAVYHDLGNLNYAITVKPKDKSPDIINDVYGSLLKGVLIALEKIGVKPCIENINDIVVGDKKISGTAASVRWNTLFLHGSLLVSTDLSILASVLKVPLKKLLDKKIKDVKYRVTRLQDILGRGVTYRELIESFIQGYSELLHAEPYIDMISKEELEIASILYRERYTKKEWNLGRQPLSVYKTIEEKISKIIGKR